MIFPSAGHHFKDPGAGGSGTFENKEMIAFRDNICRHLDAMGAKYITDKDFETTPQYLERIKTGTGSVVLETHLDSSGGKGASGSTSFYPVDADRLDIAFAKELVDACASILGIPNRGARPENASQHRRLGIMREHGTVCLLEVCFIDNKSDMAKFWAERDKLAKKIAEILVKYEAML